MRTSGSISLRIDAMERAELVTREADAEDRRMTFVTLTRKGMKVLDEVIPQHLLNKERLIAALTARERRALTRLLRKLLLSHEAPDGEASHVSCGMVVLPPRVALQRRPAVGLPDIAGVLVHSVDAGSLAEGAGIRKGDLIVAVEGVAIDSHAALRRILNKPDPRTKTFRLVRGAESLEVKVPMKTW